MKNSAIGIGILIAAVIGVALIIAGMGNPLAGGNAIVHPNATVSPGTQPSTPITLSLGISKVPAAGEDAIVSARVMSIYDAPGTSVSIMLPAGAELVAGSLSGTLDLKANEAACLNATIRFSQPGSYQVQATARKVVSQDAVWGDLKVIYLTVQGPAPGTTRPRETPPSTPITLSLGISKMPAVGEDAVVSARVMSIYDAPGTSVSIMLPAGAELVAGSLSGMLDLKANEPAYLNATIRFSQPGSYQVQATARKVVSQDAVWGDLKVLDLTIQAPAGGTTRPRETPPSTPITLSLDISKVPAVGEGAVVSARVLCIYDAPGTSVSIRLPEGAELVSGTLNGMLDLKANEPAYLNATIRFSQPGSYQVQATARKVVSQDAVWGDLKVLFITVG